MSLTALLIDARRHGTPLQGACAYKDDLITHTHLWVHSFYLPLFSPFSSTYKTTFVETADPPATVEATRDLYSVNPEESENGKQTTLRRSQDRGRQGPLVPKCAQARPADRKDL